MLGAQRSGSTSLYAALCAHPLVVPALRKEIHFLDRYHAQGLRWYLAHFPTRREIARRSDARGGQALTGEATPSYLFHPRAPERLAAAAPGARLLALLRNPVDRAYSHYQMNVRAGIEPLGFEEALDAEDARIRDDLRRAEEDPSYFGRHHRYFSYAARSRYDEQIERWLAHFDRDRLHVESSRRLRTQPSTVLSEIHAFLGLTREPPAPPEERHVAHYPPLDSALRDRLMQRFAPGVARLRSLLGRDLDLD